MSMLRWDPRDFLALRGEMEQLMQGWPGRLPQMMQGAEKSVLLPLDAYTTDNEVVITAAVPGLTPEDIEITLEGETLTIKGELKPPVENVEYFFRERPFGEFRRVLTIGVPVEADKAEAKFENGILTLTLPKAQESRPKVIKIKSK